MPGNQNKKKNLEGHLTLPIDMHSIMNEYDWIYDKMSWRYELWISQRQHECKILNIMNF